MFVDESVITPVEPFTVRKPVGVIVYEKLPHKLAIAVDVDNESVAGTNVCVTAVP
jgi:hypothetical protein